MTRPPRFLIPCLLAGAGLLVLTGESNAQWWRNRSRVNPAPVYPPGWPNHMPGWDWKYLYPYVEHQSNYPPGWPNRMPGWDEQYIYPWSPYNIGRNPYNPGYYPYPDYTPSYAPYSASVAPGGSASYQEPTYGTQTSTSQWLLPDPTGAMSTAPPGAALIRLTVPTPFAEVKFDGFSTESVGRTRYYVTPDLTSDKPFSYEVTARWQRDGNPVTQTRKIEVRRGQVTTVDFTNP